MMFAVLAAAALPEIVVTGRGLAPVPGEEAYGGAVLSRSELTATPSGRIDEILKSVPGFQTFRRSDARSANPTSQGATLRALGGNASSRALLILDGVPQTDPFGGWINWPAYDPERLGSARVVRGGGSGANGPGALAGTIELESAGPADLEGLRGGVAYGSRDSADAFAGAGVALGAGFLSLSARHGRSDGFVPVVAAQRGAVDRAAPYRQTSLSLRSAAPIGERTELQLGGLVFDDRRERGTDFSANRTQGADASLRLVGPAWSALAYVQTRDLYNSFASVAAGRGSVSQAAEQYAVPSVGLGARAEVRPTLGTIDLRLGGDWRATEGETRERYMFVNGVGTRGRIAGGRTRTLGGFAEAAWTGGAVTLTAGGRVDHWRIAGGFLAETVFATGASLTDVAFPDRSGWEPTARAGIVWRADDAFSLRTAAYRGWRLPTLNELYRPFRVGPDATAANAALDPERLNGVEAGLDWRPAPAVRIGATLFANRLGNAIANVTLGRGPGTFPGVGFVAAGALYSQRRNLDSIDARGLEIDARLDRGPWSLAAGYSLVDAEVEASGAAGALDGRRPAQTPRHTGSVTLGWSDPGGARASLGLRYVGAQFEDDLGLQSLGDAMTVDASASVPLTRSFAIEARAENIGNARVEAGITGDGIVERATPRTLWIGLRWRG